jgi:TPR repeat protein
MKRPLTLSIFLLSALGSSPSLSADFAKGLDAYQGGDYASAFEEWIPLAEQGNASAQYNLGRMYRNGDDVKQDYGSAINWYILAAEQGHANAQFKLGLMYDMGIGVDRDIGTAIMWYTLSAEQGNSNARFRLDNMHSQSEPGSEN